MMMLLDLGCYAALLLLLVYMTRIIPSAKVSLTWNGTRLPGTVLKCDVGLMNRVGLLNTPALRCGDGLYLPGVKSIHTKGMHYPIDVIFLDDAKRILSFDRSVPVGVKRLKGPKGTSSILELGAGSIERLFSGIELHQTIEVIREPQP